MRPDGDSVKLSGTACVDITICDVVSGYNYLEYV